MQEEQEDPVETSDFSTQTLPLSPPLDTLSTEPSASMSPEMRAQMVAAEQELQQKIMQQRLQQQQQQLQQQQLQQQQMQQQQELQQQQLQQQQSQQQQMQQPQQNLTSDNANAHVMMQENQQHHLQQDPQVAMKLQSTVVESHVESSQTLVSGKAEIIGDAGGKVEVSENIGHTTNAVSPPAGIQMQQNGQ